MQLSFTIKAIWNLRNQAEHKGAQVNFLAPIQALRHWIIEPAIALQTQKDHLSKDLTVWTKPPIETFKLNVDAAISVDYAALAVAAIDEKGEIQKAWTKETLDRVPAVAKAEAIFWAIQLAKLEHYQQVMVGDA